MIRILTSSLAALALTPFLAAQQFDFAPMQGYTIPDDPAGIGVGDLNNDGLLDMTVSASNPDRLDCWFNDCAGGFYFAGAVSLPLGSNPGHTVLVDLDGDGDDDAVTVLRATDQLHVTFNDGAGSFAGEAFEATGLDPLDVTFGDYDADGDQDLLVANSGDDTASLYTNDGAANFTRTDYPGWPYPFGVTFGDFDGDGDLDFAISNHDDCTLSIYTWDLGVYTNTDKIGGNNFFHCVTSADVDGDGWDDLVVAGSLHNGVDDNLYYFRSQGPNGWQGFREYPSNGVDTEKIAAGDFDCDGDVDVALGNLTSGDLSVLPNPGNGVFGTPELFAAGSGMTALVSADFDHDGAPDLASTAEGSDDLGVHLNKACGLEITSSGQCGGSVDFTVSGATPNGEVFIVFGARTGCFTIPSTKTCGGTTIGVTHGPRVVGRFTADAAGQVQTTQTLNAGVCGKPIQALDVTTCTVSNVLPL